MYFLEKFTLEFLEVMRPFSRLQRPKFGCFELQGRFTSASTTTSKGAQGIFSKITFLKSVLSKEKDEVFHSFLVKIFTNLPTEEG